MPRIDCRKWGVEERPFAIVQFAAWGLIGSDWIWLARGAVQRQKTKIARPIFRKIRKHEAFIREHSSSGTWAQSGTEASKLRIVADSFSLIFFRALWCIVEHDCAELCEDSPPPKQPLTAFAEPSPKLDLLELPCVPDEYPGKGNRNLIAKLCWQTGTSLMCMAMPYQKHASTVKWSGGRKNNWSASGFVV